MVDVHEEKRGARQGAGDVQEAREARTEGAARSGAPCGAHEARACGEDRPRGQEAGAARPAGADEQAVSRRLAGIGVGGNVALAAFKLFAGVVGGSAAMISDAVHSLSDVFATAIAFIGVRLARRTADRSHPYGHERFECVASLALGVVLAATGLGIGAACVESIATGAYRALAAPGAIALVAAVVSIVVKESMFWYTRRWARVLHSDAFMADAWHHRSDALSSVGALVGIGGAMLGFPLCDPLASAVICLVILKVAFDVVRDAIDKMIDTPCDAAFEDAVRSCVESVEGVVRIDALRTRRFGSKVYVDAEIAVDGTLSLADAHAIAETAHDAVEQRFAEVKHIMIHENPAEADAGEGGAGSACAPAVPMRGEACAG